MIITDIKYLDTKSLFLIEIDKEKLHLSYEDFEKYNLSIGQELEFDTYKILLSRSNYTLGKNLALNYLKRRFVSSHQLRDYLYRKDVESIECIIDDMKVIGLLDDANFLKCYIEDKINLERQSKNQIKNKLFQIGFRENEFSEILDSYNFDYELENGLDLARKKYGNLEVNIKNKQKIYAYLFRRGFQSENINKILLEMGY